MKTQFRVLSPDGFDISFGVTYKTKKAAENAVLQWVKRYEQQGYYSTSSREHIPLDEIKYNCHLVIIPAYN